MVKPGVASKCSSKKCKSTKSGMNESVDAYLHVKHMVPGTNEHPQNNGHDSLSERKRSRFIIIVLLFSILGNVVLGVFFLTRLSKSEAPEAVLPLSEDTHGKSVCVLCSSLGVIGDDMPHAVDRVIIGDAYMCCLRNSEHIQKLITLLSVQYSDVEESAEVESEDGGAPYRTDSAAHLYLDSTRLKKNGIVWTDEYGWGSAYIGNGVDYRNGSLIVKEDGRYFVYSFMTTKFHATPQNQNLLHVVNRRNPKLSKLGSKVLLIGKQNISKSKESFLTSYLGACVVLRAGDELTVQLNPQSAVYAYAPANYFGLFKIR